MKYQHLFSSVLISFLFAGQQVSAADGCLDPYPSKYIDSSLSPHECIKRENLDRCYIDEKCYAVNDPSVCSCLKAKGTVCKKDVPGGAFFEYCKWGNKACDTWHLAHETWHWAHGTCSEASAIPLNTENWPETYCRLVGGMVEGKDCKNFFKWGQTTPQNCSLESLWNQTCPKTPGNKK
jgi:hypothetical protein